jgi:ABC-type multidrug transport system ATPase subunit
VIVGKLKLDHGSVVVFGEPPGLGSSTGVPGSRVGYMPQEMALFGEFNISETLIYFARVFGMSREKYKGSSSIFELKDIFV